MGPKCPKSSRRSCSVASSERLVTRTVAVSSAKYRDNPGVHTLHYFTTVCDLASTIEGHDVVWPNMTVVHL